MNIQSYLDRINYDGPLEPTAEALRRLQVAHLLAVPFENLSIHARELIVLDDQTSPESHFTKARICSRLTPRGRITLSDMRFITTEGAARRERPVATQEEYADILREHFGIAMKH